MRWIWVSTRVGDAVVASSCGSRSHSSSRASAGVSTSAVALVPSSLRNTSLHREACLSSSHPGRLTGTRPEVHGTPGCPGT